MTVTQVQTPVITNNAITTEKIADNAVTNVKMADNAVTNVKMADNSVNTAELVNNSVTPQKLSQPLTKLEHKTPTSSIISFTEIPSWVKRITVMFDDLSITSWTSYTNILIQLGVTGTNSFSSTNYSANAFAGQGFISNSQGLFTNNWIYSAYRTNGFPIIGYNVLSTHFNSKNNYSGSLILTNIRENVWIGSGLSNPTGNNNGGSGFVFSLSGVVYLPDKLDSIRIIPENTSLSGGNMNIMYE